MFRTLRAVEPETDSEQSAYDKWLDQTSDREAGAADRVHGAVGVIPTPLWIVLFFIAAVIFVYMLFFADRGERRGDPGAPDRHRRAVIVCCCSCCALDNPFHDGVGGLEPVAMERTLRIVDQALGAIGARSRSRATRAARRCRREPPSAPVDARLELLATMLLALATVATAWSGYQASRWNGEQAKAVSRANAMRIESAKAAGLANAQTRSTWRRSRSGSTPTRTSGRSWPTSTEAVPRRVQAGGRRLDRDAAAEEPGRAADAVRDAAVPARRARGGGRGSKRGGGAVRPGRGEHPARDELRARRRAVRRGAVLRRDEHEAEHASAAPSAARPRRPRVRRSLWSGSPRHR